MITRLLIVVVLAAASLQITLPNAQAQTATAQGAAMILAAAEPFEFNGLDQSLNLGHSGPVNVGEGDFTVHVTVSFASLGSEPTDMSLADKMSSITDVNSHGWRLLKQADNRFWFCLGPGFSNGCVPDSSTTVISETEASPGSWHTVTGVKAAGVIQIYVDGVLEGTTVVGPFANPDLADLRVGANDPEGAFLDGAISHISLYGHALTSRQIRGLHLLTIPR